MVRKGIKRKSVYKQMAFETAVRNPERYIQFLRSVVEFEGVLLDDENLLTIISKLYVDKIVTSDKIFISKNTKFADIKDDIKKVNSSRRADGGFPSGYASRFWTYMRTLSELGFVYARYNEPFQLSQVCKSFIEGKIDEQEAFSIQAVKYNRKNPYRNVRNDFNFFTFIIRVLLELRKQSKALSYEQFIVAMFSKDGNVKAFIALLQNNTFNDFQQAYDFIKNTYHINTKFKTVMQDYPDVIRRVFIISGFITVRFSGKKHIQINENKINYINELLKIYFSISQNEKTDSLKYFEKLNTKDTLLLKLIEKERKTDTINGTEYANKLFDIINHYSIDEMMILKSIEKIGTKKTIVDEFKEIPEPLKLEFFIAILIALKYGKKYAIRPNYKADHIGKPYSHAPGNKGDIEVFSKEIYWLIEVTLIRNKTQQLNHETANIIRHFSNEEFKDKLKKYLSLVAPVIHKDVRNFFDYSIIKSCSTGYQVNIKPYDLKDFLTVTKNLKNFEDMRKYTTKKIVDFKHNLNTH